jgi:hypothetical protein
MMIGPSTGFHKVSHTLLWSRKVLGRLSFIRFVSLILRLLHFYAELDGLYNSLAAVPLY